MKKILMYSLTGLMLAGPAFAADTTAPQAPVKKSGNHWFEKVDLNHDGSITKEEFMSEHEQRFIESDTDKDGKISQTEADTQKEKWREKIKAEREKRKAEREKMKSEKSETPAAVKPAQ